MRALVARTLTLAAVATALVAPQRANAHTTPTSRPDTVGTPSTAPARWVGVYRVTFLAPKGDVLDARVLVEPNGAQLTGMLLVDQHASGITEMRIEGDALVATVVTAEGRGRLVMRADDDAGVTGTLTIGRHTWKVNGARAI